MKRASFLLLPLTFLLAVVVIAAAAPRQVLVAAKDIPDGEFLHNDMFEERTLPTFRTPLSALKRRSDAVGRLAGRPMARGNVVVRDDLFSTTPGPPEGILTRVVARFLPSAPVPPVVLQSTPSGQRPLHTNVSLEMDAANAPLLVAGLFVDIYEGESLVIRSVRVASVENRDGRVVATFSLTHSRAARLSLRNASKLRFELSGTQPAVGRPPSPAGVPTLAY